LATVGFDARILAAKGNDPTHGKGSTGCTAVKFKGLVLKPVTATVFAKH